jgi:hypothetical protein
VLNFAIRSEIDLLRTARIAGDNSRGLHVGAPGVLWSKISWCSG